ncbi:MAG: polyamine aminopropyltransferase [Sphingobacteriales bacterium]|nr:MAG: polyamine aminopropyltransferase [Sphingobacteriales bacterium]
MSQDGSLGRQIVVEYYDCEPEILSDVTLIEQYMVEAAKTAGATVINSTFHHFSPFGVSGVVVIQESHLAIHTWPEFGYASVDVFTCGDSVNPWVSYNFLKDAFKAKNHSAVEMLRGQLAIVTEGKDVKYDDMQYPDTPPAPPKYTRNIWLTDRDENIALSLRHTGEVLYKKQTPFQKVEVLDSYAYGKLLAIDNMVMCTERDEYSYHEMIVHVPMITHGDVKRVLIIGGGDGGTVREVLKHKGVEEIVMVEIDEAVVEASRLHLPSLSSGLDDPKLRLIIGDGIKYVQDSPSETYDLVIVDSSDPVGPAEGLFSREFYANCHRILKPNGIMTGQSESPRFHTKAFQELFAVYRDVFGAERTHCYLIFISTYPTGMWSFCYCSKGDTHPINSLDKEKAAAFTKEHDLNYYNEDTHVAAFAMPGFVTKLLKA